MSISERSLKSLMGTCELEFDIVKQLRIEGQAGIMHEVVKVFVELIEPSNWCCLHVWVLGVLFVLDGTVRCVGSSARKYPGS
jgi:hypothetical protein